MSCRKVCNFFTNCIVLLLIALIIFCGYKAIPDFMNAQKSKNELKSVAEIIDRNSLEESFTKESFEAIKQENQDFVGYLKFDSGIIELPVVQAKDNDYYLRRSFYKEYSEQGIPFMDADCNSNSKNVVIYGHNVYYDDNAMFSPLSFLIDQEKFEENQTFSFIDEKTKHNYKIVAIYVVDIYEGFLFQKQDFVDEKDFNDWYNFIQERNLILSNETIRYNDNFMTLQTCKRFAQDSRILVLAKEINKEPY